METMEEVLAFVQRTNPEMTMGKLIKELNRSTYMAKALIFSAINFVDKQETI